MTRPAVLDLDAARACLLGVGDQLARRWGNTPGDAMLEAAARILAAPAGPGNWMSSHPASVYHVDGHLVALYHRGSQDGQVLDGECSCPAQGLCEHLLVALALTWSQL